ncbi:hypothetical protein U9M48_040619 [Paspalum notatum var. saurae]|uniref:Uncharacterized protein n=1 Tax=Paspalum notatum var. saurae TaxID=547442 RepID=A0AAQ3UQX9_PASNO
MASSKWCAQIWCTCQESPATMQLGSLQVVHKVSESETLFSGQVLVLSWLSKSHINYMETIVLALDQHIIIPASIYGQVRVDVVGASTLLVVF